MPGEPDSDEESVDEFFRESNRSRKNIDFK
jgi:hypothetical protein